MDETAWRQQTTERLRTLARAIQSWTPNVLYGAVTGCAILPLVSAAQQGAVPYDAVYQLLGAAGMNLVTNQVQQWKDRSNAEQALPAELARLAAENADARATGCATLLSEELQSGRVVRGVTIVNPFATS